MKASEMTNDELASFFDELASFNSEDDKFRETASRLREPHNNCRIVIDALKADNDALRSKLKVAEDALEKITTGSFGHKDGDKPIVQIIIDIASNALFAIREEGGAK